jgi:hypothetical protein
MLSGPSGRETEDKAGVSGSLIGLIPGLATLGPSQLTDDEQPEAGPLGPPSGTPRELPKELGFELTGHPCAVVMNANFDDRA